jgi:calcineurin-like phosphoesterase family protein
MHQTLVSKWNERVSDEDRVYMLGDMVMKKNYLYLLGQLKGRKVLVKGNHDIFKLEDYLPYVDDIRAYVIGRNQFIDGGGYMLSHIPIHPDSLKPNSVNIHGHLHYRMMNDERYINVSVERTDYAPVELTLLLKRRASKGN